MDHKHDRALPPVKGGPEDAGSVHPASQGGEEKPPEAREPGGDSARPDSRSTTSVGVLVINEYGKEVREVRIAQDQVSIGRDPNLEIVLSDQGVSRAHARITRQEETFLLEDLGSRNGTLVNDQALPQKGRHVLRHGDIIQLGRSILRFLIHISKKIATTFGMVKETGEGRVADEREGSLCLFRLEKIEAVLLVSLKKGMPTEFRLGADRVRIGRSPESDIVLPDRSVSEKHAEIVYNKEGFHLVDCDSATGTFLDGVTVRVARIVHQSFIRFGRVKALFAIHEGGKERTDSPFELRDHLVALYPDKTRDIKDTFRESRECGLDLGEALVSRGILDPEEWWASSVRFKEEHPGKLGFLRRFWGPRKD